MITSIQQMYAAGTSLELVPMTLLSKLHAERREAHGGDAASADAQARLWDLERDELRRAEALLCWADENLRGDAETWVLIFRFIADGLNLESRAWARLGARLEALDMPPEKRPS